MGGLSGGGVLVTGTLGGAAPKDVSLGVGVTVAGSCWGCCVNVTSTLGGVARVDGWCKVGCGGGGVLGDCEFALLSNIFASSRIAASCSSPRLLNGAAGVGCVSASAKSDAAAIARSVDDSLGIGLRCGKNSTVRQIRVARVRGT